MIFLDVTLDVPTWLRPNARRALLKTAYHDLGVWVHDTLMAKHFTQEGAAEYGYRRRSARYAKRKRAKFGHNLPLVYSGETRSRVMAPVGQWSRVSATSRGVTLTFSVPRLNYRGGHAELTAVSRRDLRAMRRHVIDYIEEKIASWTETFRLSA